MNSMVAGRTGCPLGHWTWAATLLLVLACIAPTTPAFAQGADGENGGGSAIVAGDAPAPEASSAEEDDTAAPEDEGGFVLGPYFMLAIVISLFVIPMYLGGRMSTRLKMPDHGWKFAVVMGSLAAAGLVVGLGEIKFGPDLSGGITLIYELQDTADRLPDENDEEATPERTAFEKKNLVKKLIAALSERVDPSGTKEVSIREYGPEQIEIIIPKASQQELEFIERRITTAGALEFRITACPAFKDNRQIIDLANKLTAGENEVIIGGEKVAEWVAYKLEEFGPPDSEEPDSSARVVKRMAGKTPQALILTNDGWDITGDKYLRSASTGFDTQARPEVRFKFNPQGAGRFGKLTGDHLPNDTGQDYYLGILLDNKLLSAPSIRGKITTDGQITGDMGQEEVDFLVGILNAGSLPAALNKEPISRNQISATLGAATIEKGRVAILISLAMVTVFMLFYYRFAGMVACLALAANLLLILGLMVLIKAAFTLPGLAGLVLTIGMSVDANVLIFERIREERKHGAALRMAIRNGFAKATQTIVDANVTTLITAFVIWKIAPDNVKGFGVTLILGILMSMYTAIFVSRIIFDVAERSRRLKEMGMRQIIGETNFRFVSKRMMAAIVSTLLIAVGIFAVRERGRDLLNIDFTGGSSVTMVLNTDQAMEYEAVKDLLNDTELVNQNMSLVEVGETGTQFRVNCVEQDILAVENILHETFGDRLSTYHIDVNEEHGLPSATQTSLQRPRIRVTPVALQQEADDSTAEAESNSTAVEDSEGEEPTSDEPTSDEPTSDEQSSPAEVDTPDTTSDQPPIVLGDQFAGGTAAQLKLSIGGSDSGDAGITFETISQLLQDALDATGHGGSAFQVTNEDYQIGSARRFNQWDVKIALPPSKASEVFDKLKETTNSQPVFPLSNKIGGRVAGDMTTKAIAAIVVSLLGIVVYIWFRFQGVIYGFAAVVALIHDVLVALGMIALSGFVVSNVPALANVLMIEKFQISLPIVAAFLTIIGYSLNDTIVVFDRIREVKAKSPKLTEEMIDKSINQTLSRTLLTSMTTLLTVIILYAIGGDGIHGFAFSLVVGVLVGTYSSIFIASPTLLWMSQRIEASKANQGARAA